MKQNLASGWQVVERNRMKQPVKVKDPSGKLWAPSGRGEWSAV